MLLWFLNRSCWHVWHCGCVFFSLIRYMCIMCPLKPVEGLAALYVRSGQEHKIFLVLYVCCFVLQVHQAAHTKMWSGSMWYVTGYLCGLKNCFNRPMCLIELNKHDSFFFSLSLCLVSFVFNCKMGAELLVCKNLILINRRNGPWYQRVLAFYAFLTGAISKGLILRKFCLRFVYVFVLFWFVSGLILWFWYNLWSDELRAA